MRPIRLAPTVLAPLLAALACASPTADNLPQEEPNQAFSIFDGIRQQLVIDHNEGRAEELADLFVEDGSLVLPEDGSTIEGQSAIQARYQTLFAAFTAELSMTADESRITDGENAFERGEFTLVLDPAGGAAAPSQFNGTYELRGIIGVGGMKITALTFDAAG